MRTRRTAAALVVATIAAGGFALATAPVALADQTITVDCESDFPSVNREVTTYPGETITVVGTACDYAQTDPNERSLFSVYIDGEDGPPPYVWVVSESAPLGTVSNGGGTPVFSVDSRVASSGELADPIVCGEGFYVRVAAAPTVPDAEAASTPIPDWVQAYGRATRVAPCQDGWSPSWQAWAEQITNGWVCTRTVPSLS